MSRLDFIAEGAPMGAPALRTFIDNGDIKIGGESRSNVQIFFSDFDPPAKKIIVAQ